MLKEKVYKKLPERRPAVAGQFYPSSKEELSDEVTRLLEQAGKITAGQFHHEGEIRAIIAPHAGYVFSGLVAASAFLRLKNNKDIRRVFLIGSSHHAWFEGASIYYENNYITPLGKVEVDRETAIRLMTSSKIFRFHPEAHGSEHSLEVQLPFLQYILESDFTIVPIIIGGQSKETPKTLAGLLKPYFRSGNLFIISTDLSHYPGYNDAVKVDKQTVESICLNEPVKFIDQLRDNEKKKIQNLSTSICGWTSVLTLLYLTGQMKDIRYVPALYQNSGDVALYGEKTRVVGYQSIVVTSESILPEKADMLNSEERKLLLSIARESIANNLKSMRTIPPDEDALPRALKQRCGAFVSVYVDNELRGCIGSIENDELVYTTIQKMAVASASRDYRFSPIHQSELDKLHIEISLLTPLQKVTSPADIIPGKHGILIRKDSHSGTFLPQVAEKTGWNAIEMLSQCSERKAGLGREGWKEADIFIYEAEIFSDK